MPGTEAIATTRKPSPPEADFAFHIDFRRGEGPASRVFAATHAFIEACEALDRELAASIDTGIETVMVLEDIEAASLKTWFRTVPTAADDQALKQLDWKPAVGKYLVRAKYLVLRWIDADEGQRDLLSLRRDIRDLARETDARQMPDYAPVDPRAIVDAVQGFEAVKDHLVEGDRAAMVVSEEETADFNLAVRLDRQTIEALAVRETRTHSVPSMVLVVRRPDYLGGAMWQFRHGRRSISATVGDAEWLAAFQNRAVDVRPGDALSCEVRVDVSYGHDNELIAERHHIVKVHEVLENQYGEPAPTAFPPADGDG